MSELRNSRAIVALSVFSCTILGGIALFQVGVLKHLPDPPLPGFDADAVHGSADAYKLLHTPDALLGMVSYSITGCLAARTAPGMPLAVGAKTALDVVQAARLSLKQATKLHKYSIWSLLVTGATVAAFSLAWPEARSALRGR